MTDSAHVSGANVPAVRPVLLGMRAALAALISLAGTTGLAHAQTQPPADRWNFSVTPYLWLPSFKGNLNYQRPPGTGSPDVSVDETSPYEGLDGAFMIAGEARRGKWSFFGDYIYLKLSTSKSAVRSVDFNPGAPSINPSSTTANAGTDSSITGDLLTLAAGYSLAGTPDAPFDVFGGLRFLAIKAKSSWHLSAAIAGPGPGQTFAAAGDVSKNEDVWDGVIGVRGRAKLADRWYVPYYLDVGAGSSSLTWQALAGISYAYRWGEVTLAYRHLYYDQKSDKLLQDFKFSGPLLGATFRF